MQPLPPNTPPGTPNAGPSSLSDQAQNPWGPQQPSQGYPPAAPAAKSNTGLVVGIVVAVVVVVVLVAVGTIAALAIAGTRKYISAAKTAEAVNNVTQIGMNASEAYTRASLEESLGNGAGPARLCRSARHPVPTSIVAVTGKKYQSTSTEWLDGDATTGWQCLKYEMIGPQYYQYDYKATRTSFDAVAHGDLDGDGTTSSYTLTGSVSAGAVTLGLVDKVLPDE